MRRPLLCRSVCVSVCLSVSHNLEPYENGWTDRDAICSEFLDRLLILFCRWVQSVGRSDVRDIDDDDDEDDEDDAKLQSGVDPDRLKAFNVYTC